MVFNWLFGSGDDDDDNPENETWVRESSKNNDGYEIKITDDWRDLPVVEDNDEPPDED